MTGSKWITAAALTVWAFHAQATNGMRMIGFGPVQSAMGGVSVGAPLDAATTITNPAGMAFTGGRFDFGVSYFDASVKYRATGAASGAEQTSSRRPSPIPAFGLVVPLGEQLAFGLGGYGVAGLGVDYPQDLLGGRTFTSYSQMRFSPGLSYQLSPELAVGAAINVMYGTMEYSAAGGLGVQPRDMAIAYGAGATVGAVYRPVEQLSVGLAYESHSWFQDYSFNVPAHTIVVDPTTGATATVPGGVEKLEFDQPPVLTLGVGVKPLGGLVLAADVQWIRWSETNGANLPKFATDPALTGGMQLDLHWSDQWVLKIGAEYAALPWLKLRAGYNYGKSPVDADRAVESIAFPALAEHHVTAGAGVQLGRAALNLAGTWAPEVKRTGANLAQGVASYETKLAAWTVDAGVSYRF